MMHPLRPMFPLLVVCLLVAGCDDDPASNEEVARVDMHDDCDPASFNDALGAGTCTGLGTTTFAEFNLELESTGEVDAWRNDPTSMTIEVGQSIAAYNLGGEEHTFTEVAEYGGGIVPELNDASGNPDPAPECLSLTAADFVAAGGTFVTEEEDEAGTDRYQCCIHPWMRTTVTVNPR